MLKKLRKKKTAKKIWIILAVLILPAFILWGSGSLLSSKNEAGVVGKIWGRTISSQEFQDSFNAVKNQAIMQFGDDFSKIKKGLDLTSQAWDRLILLQEAKKRKLSASDVEVIRLIESYPFFQNAAGFNKLLYAQMLQYVFHTQARIFEEQTRQSLLLSKLFQDATGGVNLSAQEIREEYRKANEEVSIYYITSLFSDFEKDVVVDNERLKDYFQKNSLQFKVGLSFNIEYVNIASEDKDEATKQRVKKIFTRLVNKKDSLEKIAKENGLDLKETGFFTESGPIPGIGWSPQIINLISLARVGEYLAPLHIDKSYYILRLKQRKEPYVPDFDSVRELVKAAFVKDSSKSVAKEKIENCLKSLKELSAINPKAVDFNKAAKTFSLKSDSTALFKYGSYIEGIGISDRFWTFAQGLKEDEFSDILEMPTGFYIIKLKSKSSFEEKKFQNERKEFAQKLLFQKKYEVFNRYLEELKKGVSFNLP